MSKPGKDRRLIAANGRVAASWLKGQVTAKRYLDGEMRQLIAPIADLLTGPNGSRSRQILFGEAFLALEDRDGFTFGQAARDGYVGYVKQGDLGPPVANSHWVSQRTSHIYQCPDIKSPDIGRLSFASQVSVLNIDGSFAKLRSGGFAPLQHLRPLGEILSDPASVAELFLGTPYLWGGNGGDGIDCSGLIQAACLACGLACPRDSDQQQGSLGHCLDKDMPFQRGDLLFWKGHVGMMLDQKQLIHANAHHMSVAVEPLRQAMDRISANEFGPVLARKRLTF